MSFAEVKQEVLRMTDAQKKKLMLVILGSQPQWNEKRLAQMQRRRQNSRHCESLTRTQVMEKHGIIEAEVRKEAHALRCGRAIFHPTSAEKQSRVWLAEIERRRRQMKAGSKLSRKEAMRMLGITESDLARTH